MSFADTVPILDIFDSFNGAAGLLIIGFIIAVLLLITFVAAMLLLRKKTGNGKKDYIDLP